MNNRKLKKYSKEIIVHLVLLLLVIAGGFIWGRIYEHKRNELFKGETAFTNATVVDYSAIMGSTILKYEYEVNGVIFESNISKGGLEGILPVGTNNLKVEYSIIDPTEVRIVDDRVKFE